MAAVSLVTAGTLNIVSSETQFTAPFAESVNVGQCVRLDATTGKWTKANATDSTENRIIGILVSRDAAGAVGTVVRKGVLNGFDLAPLNFGAYLYLSDTDGTVADAAGTVSTLIGRVVSGFSTTLGTTSDKLFFLDL
jgi:hypothetical protein